MRLLVEGLPEAHRAGLAGETLEVLMKAHERQGTHPPDWLRVLWREQGEARG